MNTVNIYGLTLCSFFALFTSRVSAQIQPPCPVPPTSVEATVKIDVSFNKSSNLYTYKYSLQNSNSSLLKISDFFIATNEAPQNLTGAKKWSSEYQPEEGAIFWQAGVRADLDIGAKIDGFSFQSSRPPGPIRYYVRGLAKIPKSVPTATDDEPTPDCPGFYFNVPREQRNVVGVTQGPMPPGLIDVKIRIHREEGNEDERVCKFESDEEGFMFVTLLDSDQLNVANVDTSSVVFGPASAKPISIKIIGPAGNDKSSVNAKKLVMKFNIKDLGLRCNIDRALFVSGKVSGSTFFGGAEVKPSICQPKPQTPREPKKSKKMKVGL